MNEIEQTWRAAWKPLHNDIASHHRFVHKKDDLAKALGLHPAKLKHWMSVRGAPGYHASSGFDVEEFRQFINTRTAS